MRLQAEEVEIMCVEMYQYFQDAEQALSSNEIRTEGDASELVVYLGEIKAFLRDALVHEKETGGSRKSIRPIELLAGRCATVEERAMELRSCFSIQGESCFV